MEDIGKAIAKLRKDYGLTQQDLAKKINYSDKVISKWERGESLPDINAINSIASFFNISIDELVLNKCDKNVEYQAPLKMSSKYFLPLFLLQVILLLCSAVLFVRALVAVLDINGLVLNGYFTRYGISGILGIVFSGLFVILLALDLVFAMLKIKRKPLIILAFSMIFVSLIILLVSYCIYGAYSNDKELNSLIFQYSIGAVFIAINFLLERHVFSKQNKSEKIVYTKFISEKIQNKINFITLITNLGLIVLIFALMFIPCYYLNVHTESLLYGIPYATDVPYTESFMDFVSASNGWFIACLVIFLLICVWDIIQSIFYFIDKYKGKPYKHLSQKSFRLSSLITGILFFLIFLATQIAFWTSAGVFES